MIPVLIVPVLNGRPLLERMLASVDVPVGCQVVVDNGGAAEGIAGRVALPGNIGVAAAWNLGIKATPTAPWWFITNHDVTFRPGDLARLCGEMAAPGPRVVTMLPDGFSAFGISREAVERVGYFDENFVPAYCEDADYEYRCRLAGVPIIHLPTGTSHVQSATINTGYGADNARTYPENVAYYTAKWGGRMRSGETYASPFDAGGSVSAWTGDHHRRATLGWAS